MIILVCSRELKITSLYFYLLDGIMEKSMSIFEIEKEIQQMAGFILDELKRVDYYLYALFLSQAYYEPLYMQCPQHVPYGTEEYYSRYVDETRLTFFCKYMNHFRTLPKWDEMDNDSVIYEISSQLMLYSHIWESRSFLTCLIQIVSILSNHKYKWIINFPKAGKGNMIKQNILDLLPNVNEQIRNFITSCYDIDLRNSFAHSAFIIDTDKREIQPLEPTHCYSLPGKNISFAQWEDIFLKLAAFSYYLPVEMNERRFELITELAKSPLDYKLPLYPNNPKGGSVDLILGVDSRRGYAEFMFYKKRV